MSDRYAEIGMRDHKAPLDAGMSNVTAWRLGEACNAAAGASAGDLIDRGLALLQALNKLGYDVVLRPSN